MRPAIWGPYIWTSIHLIALEYPENPTHIDKLNYKTFYAALGGVLPCSGCSKNYTRHFLELPIDDFLDSPKSLFIWTIKLHNIVNIETGKAIWNEESAYKYYQKMQNGLIPVKSPTVSNPNKVYILAQLVFFLAIISILILRNHLYKK